MDFTRCEKVLGGSARRAIGTRPGPNPYKHGLDSPGMHIRTPRIPRRGPLEPWTPRSHRTLLREVRCRPPKRGSRLPKRDCHPTAVLPALGRATQAPRARSARAPFDLVQGGGWLPPPTRSNASHQRTTLWPSDLGESGWASRVARASQIRTKSLGRRVRHFGARNRISCYPASPQACGPQAARPNHYLKKCHYVPS